MLLSITSVVALKKLFLTGVLKVWAILVTE